MTVVKNSNDSKIANFKCFNKLVNPTLPFSHRFELVSLLLRVLKELHGHCVKAKNESMSTVVRNTNIETLKEISETAKHLLKELGD